MRRSVILGHTMSEEESTTPIRFEPTRRGLEAMNRGDRDAAIRDVASDAVWDTSRNGVATFEGAATIRDFWEGWVRGYEELEFVSKELLDVGNGVVFAVVRQQARPVGTTGYVRQLEGFAWIWTDGLCASITVCPEGEIDEARAAAERLPQERG